jgi:hypothetical protein
LLRSGADAPDEVIADGMDLNGFRRANRGLTPKFLRAFAAFLSKGRFTFGWDS